MKEPALAPLLRFMKLMPKGDDAELSLLKSHLLVEEALTKLIANVFKNPDYLPDANLKFMQKVALAKAVDKLDHSIWIWGALERLNKARNALSHLLDDKKLEERIKEFIEYVGANSPYPNPQVVAPPFGRFGWAAFMVFSVISVRANFDPAAIGRQGFGSLIIPGDPHQPVLGQPVLFSEEKK